VKKVTRQRTGDNRRATAVAALLVVAVASAAILTGCGGGGGASDGADAADRHVADGCALVMDTTALQAFWRAADRVAAGEEVTLEELGDVAALPTWELWRRSFEPERIAAAPVARSLFIALRGQEELPDRLSQKSYRIDLVRSYEATLERRPLVEQYVQTFRDRETACGVPELLAGWVPPEALPDTLRVDFVPGHAEIRLYEGHFMLDPGMAWAAGQAQIVRFLASTLYRDLATVEGPSPDQASGPEIALQAMRVVRNEGIPAYLDRMDEIAFDGRHMLLASAAPVPENLCDQAMRTLRSLDTVLTRLLAWDQVADEQWQQVYRLFVGAQSWQPTGWYMARVIADTLGEERLQEASRTVAGFWAAYHEAAAQQPAQPTARPGSVSYFLQQAPRLDDGTAAWIEEQLRRRFG